MLNIFLTTAMNGFSHNILNIDLFPVLSQHIIQFDLWNNIVHSHQYISDFTYSKQTVFTEFGNAKL